MKIEMLKDRFDDEANGIVWQKGERFDVKEDENVFYIVTNVKGLDYGVYKQDECVEFVVVGE